MQAMFLSDGSGELASKIVQDVANVSLETLPRSRISGSKGKCSCNFY